MFVIKHYLCNPQATQTRQQSDEVAITTCLSCGVVPLRVPGILFKPVWTYAIQARPTCKQVITLDGLHSLLVRIGAFSGYLCGHFVRCSQHALLVRSWHSAENQQSSFLMVIDVSNGF